MQKLVIASAALAAFCFSGVALAAEATTGTSTTAAGPAAMSDSDLDKVTAGLSVDPNPQCQGPGQCSHALGHEVGGPPNSRGSDRSNNSNAAIFSD
jgi:hypothetical protein